MKVLILSNEQYTDFILKACLEYSNEHEFGVKVYGEYDWSEEYDVGISFMYQYKVPKEQLDTHTWINFHPGPLPEYKGRNLCYHAIMNGEMEFGATVHYMDEGFDTGDIIDVHRFYIQPEDTAESLSEFTIRTSKALFEVYFPRILDGEDFLRYPNAKGTYYKKTYIPDHWAIELGSDLDRFIRAVTYKDFHPILNVGGVEYEVIRK